jgi:hypothetical protein
MKLTLSGKEFTLRCDFLALAKAKREAGIELGKLNDGDVVNTGTLLFYMAQSGAKHAGIPFKQELDDFLALIDISDMPALEQAITDMFPADAEKKS